MKKTIFLLLILITTCSVKAQDVMITKDGKKISAKIEEIGIEIVKYKKFENQNGPTYSINKNEVASIMYENGDIDVFSKEKKEQNTTPKVQVEKTVTTGSLEKNEKQEQFTLVGKIFAAEVSGQYQFLSFKADKKVEYTVRNRSLTLKQQNTYTYNLDYPKLEILQDNLIKGTFFFIDRNTLRRESHDGFFEFIKL